MRTLPIAATLTTLLALAGCGLGESTATASLQAQQAEQAQQQIAQLKQQVEQANQLSQQRLEEASQHAQ